MIDTSLDSSNFYFLLAVFQGVILSIIILSQNSVKKASLFIGILVGLFSFSLLHLLLEESISAFNSKYPIPMEFSLAYGPLAYFHVLYIKDPMRSFKWKDLLHFVPSFLLDAVFFTSFFVYVRNNLDWAYDNILTIQTSALVFATIGLVQFSIYTYLLYTASRSAQPVLRAYRQVKKWLNYLIVSWATIITFLLISVPVALYFIQDLDENSSLIYKPLGIIWSILIYVLGYSYVLKYQKVIGNYSDSIKKFKFTEVELLKKKQEIHDALREELLYKDSDISVSKLAGHLGWPINNLSQVINESLNTNFNDLINQYRVDAFIEKISEPENSKFSILGLGQEVGFSSKASFYRAFKKVTGMTPSDYLKSNS
ncbi:MAG: helix-turn-helix domain-containing protein [Ekhidna sp.]